MSELMKCYPGEYIFGIPKAHIEEWVWKHPSASLRLDIAQEECAELIQAISKAKRYGSCDASLNHEWPDIRASLVEELTHVLVMAGSLAQYYGIRPEEIFAEVMRKARKDEYDLSEYPEECLDVET